MTYKPVQVLFMDSSTMAAFVCEQVRLFSILRSSDIQGVHENSVESNAMLLTSSRRL